MPKPRKSQVKELLLPYFSECPEVAKELSEKIVLIFKKKFVPNSETDLHIKCREWFIQYCDDNKLECQWSGSHGLDLNIILGKIKVSYEKRNKVFAMENDLFISFKALIEKLPIWYREKLSLKTIHMSWDKIINEIRSNGVTKKARGQHSDKEILESVYEFTRKSGNANNQQKNE